MAINLDRCQYCFQAFVAFIVIVVINMSLIADARAQGGALGPYQPSVQSSPVKDVGFWHLTLVRLVNTEDSIWITSAIVNQTSEIIEFDAEDYCGALTMTMSGEAEDDSRSVQLKTRAGLQSFSYRRFVESRKPFLLFRVDLRSFFGKRKPGKYKVQFELDRSKFQVSGKAANRKQDWKSPVVEIEISSVEMKISDIPIGGHQTKLIASVFDKTRQVVTSKITNRRDTTVFLPLVEPRFSLEQNDNPLRLRANVIRYGRGVDLGPSSVVHSGLSLSNNLTDKGRLYPLAPGKSVEVSYPKCDGDGIFSYRHRVLIGRNMDTARHAEVVSNWFQIERLVAPNTER